MLYEEQVTLVYRQNDVSGNPFYTTIKDFPHNRIPDQCREKSCIN